MEYMTAKEAAGKWKISQRLVQRYCAEGRIAGCRKFGWSWEIPRTATKPEDPRHNDTSMFAPPVSFNGLMPLMNTSFKPGSCRKTIENFSLQEDKDIAIAEYYYFSGQPEKAIRHAKPYMHSSSEHQRLSACLIYAYANLSLSEIQQAKAALSLIHEALSANSSPSIAAEDFIAFTSAVLLHLPLPKEMPPIQSFLTHLPPGLRAFALYVEAHYLYLKGEYGKSVGITEATLEMGASQYPIPAIYLHLIAVMDYMSLKDKEQAERHLLSAWNLAQPDDLIEAFGEHHGLLGGMLEAVIKPQWPEDFKRIIEITYRFSYGWRRIHNPTTGEDVADDLTTTEFAVAMLAARGWTNQEIASHMNISVHTVKHHISTILQKLNIHQRQQLKQYMLK